MNTNKSDAVTELERDIGVPFDYKLDFSMLIHYCVNKTTNKIDILIRSFEFMYANLFVVSKSIFRHGRIKLIAMS